MTLYCIEKVVSGIVTFRQNINNTNKYDSLQIIDHKKKQVLEIPTLPLLITVSSTAIQVQINNKKKLEHILFHIKRPPTLIIMNDNINMDTTIVGSVNDVVTDYKLRRLVEDHYYYLKNKQGEVKEHINKF